MKETKVHALRSSALAAGGMVSGTTFCGRAGSRLRGFTRDYTTPEGAVFEAVDASVGDDTSGVTCEHCRRGVS